MPNRKKRRPSPAGATTDPAPTKTRRNAGEPELLAVVAAVLCGVHAWLGGFALNPDGVSYLDLANRVAVGDWSALIQGYWSPLYPVLIGLLSSLTGRDPAAMAMLAHAINGAVAIAAIGLLWWWSREVQRPYLSRAMLATILLVSAGLPRIEAVTPDLLLLGTMTWIGYQLLVRRGERWFLTGILFGLTFLIKTSSWPWLLLSIPLRLWGSPDGMGRRSVLKSTAVCAAVMLIWIVPLSAKAGHYTLGSAGRLNRCWYIDACDSRTPDTHLGKHSAYHQLPGDPIQRIVWAEFPNPDRWTYTPWSDPTAWDAGVVTRNWSPPSIGELIAYWGRQARNSFGLWLAPVFLGVLLPWSLLNWGPDTWQQVRRDRTVVTVALLGLAGIFQFVLIHSEPRLIAPFGLLFALALLQGLSGEAASVARFPPAARRALSILSLFVAAGFATLRLREGFIARPRINRVIASMAFSNSSLAANGKSQARLVILGPALPVEAAAFLSGSHIVAQLLPGSVAVVTALSAEQQRVALATMFGGKAQVAWLTTATGGVSIVMIPPE
ncbi:MAG TPA: hypothetical protein VLB12_15525 [Gemmatimonadales bacterium]|nr:hypothetical protein [Gemmatimonadales bacterium]